MIVDFSLYFDWVKLAFAISCLERDDVLYLSGAQDEWVVCSSDTKLLGNRLIKLITINTLYNSCYHDDYRKILILTSTSLDIYININTSKFGRYITKFSPYSLVCNMKC